MSKRTVTYSLGWSKKIPNPQPSPIQILQDGKRIAFPYGYFEVENTAVGIKEAEDLLIKDIREWADAVRKATTLDQSKPVCLRVRRVRKK